MVREGYKQTEVGVIPEDWSYPEVNELLELLTDYEANGSFETVAANVRVRDTENYAWYVRATDLENNSSLNELKFVDEDSYKFLSKTSLYGGELLITKRGEIGKVYLFNKRTSYATLAPNLYLLKLNKKTLNDYLYYFFISNSGQRLLKKNDASSTLGALYKDDVKSIKVPMPSLGEQRAISTALSDVDALIAALDKLIAKQRHLKTATMQQLLTGKKRLLGFGGEWLPIRISQHANLKARIGWQALTTAEYLDNGSFFLVTGTDFQNGAVNWSTCHFVSEWRYKQDKNIQLHEDDVLLTKDGTIGKVGYVENMPKPATLNSGVFVIRPIDESFHPRFLYYVLDSEIFNDFLRKIFAGSTISHLYQKDFVTFEFLAPDLEEQRAIATVLSDIDAEIAALEARRAKTQAIKQGMMQELLTGRTRLTINS